jgi:hypothetical protein
MEDDRAIDRKFARILVELEALRRMVHAKSSGDSLTHCFQLARFNAALSCGLNSTAAKLPLVSTTTQFSNGGRRRLAPLWHPRPGIRPEAIVSLSSLEAVPEKEENEHPQDDEARHRASERNPPKVGEVFQKNRGDPRRQQPQASAIVAGPGPQVLE